MVSDRPAKYTPAKLKLAMSRVSPSIRIMQQKSKNIFRSNHQIAQTIKSKNSNHRIAAGVPDPQVNDLLIVLCPYKRKVKLAMILKKLRQQKSKPRKSMIPTIMPNIRVDYD